MMSTQSQAVSLLKYWMISYYLCLIVLWSPLKIICTSWKLLLEYNPRLAVWWQKKIDMKLTRFLLSFALLRSTKLRQGFVMLIILLELRPNAGRIFPKLALHWTKRDICNTLGTNTGLKAKDWISSHRKQCDGWLYQWSGDDGFKCKRRVRFWLKVGKLDKNRGIHWTRSLNCNPRCFRVSRGKS